MAALILEPESGWHTYWENPGDTGLPTRLTWRLMEGAHAGEIVWPVPERIVVGGLVNFGFHGKTVLPVEISPPKGDSGIRVEAFTIDLTARWLVCEEVCIPGKADFSLVLPWAKAGTVVSVDADASRIIADALMARRVELGDRARFVVRGNALSVALSTAASEEFLTDTQAAASLAFLPLTPDALAHATPASVWVQDGELRIRAATRVDAEPFERLSGVVVVSNAGVNRQYQIEAELDASWVPQFTPPRGYEESLADANLSDGTASTLWGASTDVNENPSLLLMAIFGFLGGMILNLMPCVFPVLSLKVVKLAESRGVSPRHRRATGFAYTAGTVATFLGIACILLVLRATGEQIGWGFQLQSPVFVTLMAYLLFFLGLSMSGMFELGAGLTRVGNISADDSKLMGSFATGALATIVATPCTAPFMGTAMGFAVAQPPHIALIVFTSLGLGLASPFLAVALIPAMGTRLPRPGVWMQTLKEVLAFPLFLTCVWLLWVLARQAGPDALARALIGGVLLGLAAWFYRAAQQRRMGRFAPIGTLLALVGALLVVPVPPSSEEKTLTSVAWSEAALDTALQDGRAVFVNFTADWCITCKVNERAAIERPRVADYFLSNDVLYLKADWSLSDPAITRALAEYGRSGVPLYVVFRAGESEPIFLPQVLTPDTIVSAFQRP